MTRNTRAGDVMVNLIVVLVFLTAACLAGGYAMGWIQIDSSHEKTTIEIKTQEIKDATDHAAQDLNRELDEFGHEAGKTLERAGESFQGKDSSPDVPVKAIPGEPPVAPDVIPRLDSEPDA